MCFEIFAKRFHNQGYQPIPVFGKTPKVDNWQTIPIDQTIIDYWITIGHYGANVGIRHQPALDVDVYDEAAATMLEQWIREKLGKGFTRRYGHRPKFLVPVKSECQRKMMSAAFSIPGETQLQRIEFLSQGQQWVCAGVHPDTKTDYTWETDEDAVPFFKTKPSQLPEFTTQDIEELFDAFEDYCHALGWTEVKPRPGHQRSPLLTAEEAADAVKSQPKSATPMDEFNRKGDKHIRELLLDRGWQKGGTGSIPVAGPDGSTVQIPTERWTRPGKSAGVSATLYKSPSTGIWYLRVWSTSIPELEAEAQYIGSVWAKYVHNGDFRAAIGDFRKMGFMGDERTPEEDFGDLRSEEDILGAFLSRFIFSLEGPSVIDTRLPPDKAVLTLRAFKEGYQNVRAMTGKTKIMANAWLQHPARATVRGVKYQPGEDRIFTDERGVTWYNIFSMPDWLYTESEDRITAPLEHIRFLLGDGADYYLGWMSHIISKPGDRPMVTPLLISAHHGTGRGWVDELMKRILGVWNCSATTIDALAGVSDDGKYQEYMHETIYCSIPEAKGSRKARFEVNDAIRDKLTATHAQLNLKYGSKGYTPIFTAFHMASNHRLVFTLDPVDRRVYVKECLHPPKPPEYYDRLYAWLEDPENLRQWYWYLRRFNKRSGWNPKAPAPMTREKATMCNVDADRPEAAAIVALMVDEGLPAVMSFRHAQAATTAIMRRLLPPEEHYKAVIPSQQLKSILTERCVLALQGAKAKLGNNKYGRVYILRDNLRWVNATQAELSIELQKWDDFDLSVLEFTSPMTEEG